MRHFAIGHSLVAVLCKGLYQPTSLQLAWAGEVGKVAQAWPRARAGLGGVQPWLLLRLDRHLRIDMRNLRINGHLQSYKLHCLQCAQCAIVVSFKLIGNPA